jgi:hypothetical protein
MQSLTRAGAWLTVSRDSTPRRLWSVSINIPFVEVGTYALAAICNFDAD